MKILIFIALISSNDLFAQQLLNVLSHVEIQSSKLTEPTIKTSMQADFNTDLLQSGYDLLRLQLPNNTDIIVQKSRIDLRSKNKFSWFGHIGGEIDNKVNFAVVEGSISGSIFSSRGVFEVVALGNNRVQIIELNTKNFDQCDGAVNPQIGLNDEDIKSDKDFNKGAGNTLDVLIVYSNNTLSVLGSHASVESTAQAAINNMNTSLANSLFSAGVDEVRLMATVAIDRDESGSSSSELNWLSNDVGVLALRNLYGADLISMISATTGCGIGYVMRSPGSGFSESAFQVTRYDCAVGNLTMAHEFGHNLGLEHNVENSSAWPNNGSYPYSFGHYHDGEYRTVMSYSAPCTMGCSRRMYYSNPDVSYLGLATGVVDLKDNTRSLEQTTLIAVNFRDPVEDNIFFDGFE